MNHAEAWARKKRELGQRIDEIRKDLRLAEAELIEHIRKEPKPTRINESGLSPDDKIRLFRERFVGRDDVYARRWENPKTGKSGYSPQCRNEWVRGICEKPKVRCALCLHRDFLPLDDSVIKGHLQGKLVAGVYPLTQRSETIFLAADFDGEHWRRDVRAASTAAKELGVPVAIERSRSGEGAHLWIYFDGPVPSAQARRLGFQILSRAMDHEDRLPLSSYDRLFPNQDAMPDGGFGNLIALPLQRAAREQGNTVFLDDDLEPLPDPWVVLKRQPLVSLEQLESWVGTEPAVRFRRAEEDGEEEVPPWLRNPSRTSPPAPITNKPDRLKVVQCQSLFIANAGLPVPIKARIKRLAILANPDFHRKEAMRLAVAGTPRVIRCFEEDEQWLALPRGCRIALEHLALDLGISLDWEDRTFAGKPLEVAFRGDLRDGQAEAVTALEIQTLGILCAPPGSGKTVMAAGLIARRKVNTLILVHRQPLVDQWKSRLSTFLGLDPKDIGTVSGGKARRNGALDVAMVQSLLRDARVEDWIGEYGMVIVDECHHVPAVSIEKVLKEVKARFVHGLTATPRRKDGLHGILHHRCGPILHRITETSEAAELEKILEIRETGVAPVESEGAAGIQAQFGALADNESRTARIIQDILALLDDGFHPLVLTERVEHLQTLEAKLRIHVPNLIVLKGGESAKRRKAKGMELLSVGDNDRWAILATGRYIGEGFDEPRLDALVLAMPISWKGTLTQYAGRILRHHPGKSRVRILDYVDDGRLLQSMARKRRTVWRALGFRQNHG